MQGGYPVPKTVKASERKLTRTLTQTFHQEATKYPGDGRRASVTLGRSPSVMRNRAEEMKRTAWWVIDPRRSKWAPYWDLVMVGAFGFTASITPVEVSFLGDGSHMDGLWFANRVVDLCFCVDIVLNFCLGFKENQERGGHWVLNHHIIARKYIRGWFFIDFFSILPFWLVALDYAHPLPYLPGEVRDDFGEDSVTVRRAAMLSRVIKLIRMVKLTRVFKASAVIERHLLDMVMTRWECTYAQIKLAKLVVALVLYAHWLACVWGLASSYMETAERTWLSAFAETFETVEGRQPGPMENYAAALYWSTMTLTGIGYGAMTPENTAERVLCSFYMLFSGMVWTYAIGLACSIATTLNPNGVLFENTMDSLNHFMRERNLPRPMRMLLRDYFSSARRVHQLSDDGELLDKMSPLLQGTVALTAYKQWIDHIW